MKIADIIRAGVAADKPNDMILTEVKKAYPEANTNAACVNWYRNKAKKSTDKVVKKAKTETPKTIAPLAVAIGHGWAVMGVKTFLGREGSGYNADLYRNGVLVARVIDDASGGPLTANWVDKCSESIEIRDFRGEVSTRRCTPEEKILLAYVETLPQYESFGHMVYKDGESFIDDLVNDAFLLKQLKSLVKGKVAFLTSDNKIYTVKGELTPKLKADIAAKHPGAQILNELTETQGIALMVAQQS